MRKKKLFFNDFVIYNGIPVFNVVHRRQLTTHFSDLKYQPDDIPTGITEYV